MNEDTPTALKGILIHRTEGDFPMPVYQGKQVKVVRVATKADKGFDEGTPKSVITLPDGSEKTVPTTEVTE